MILSEQAGSQMGAEVMGWGWRGEVDPVGWRFSHSSAHLNHLSILLKCMIWI